MAHHTLYLLLELGLWWQSTVCARKKGGWRWLRDKLILIIQSVSREVKVIGHHSIQSSWPLPMTDLYALRKCSPTSGVPHNFSDCLLVPSEPRDSRFPLWTFKSNNCIPADSDSSESCLRCKCQESRPPQSPERGSMGQHSHLGQCYILVSQFLASLWTCKLDQIGTDQFAHWLASMGGRRW